MSCDVSREQLWSWIDRDDPELEEHLATCPQCRSRAEEIRANIGLITSDLAALNIPLPERIGSYRVVRLLGEGGQALVYEAEQPSPKRLVALKVLKGGRFAGRAHVKHFRRETQTLAALNHPAIATIYEAGVTEDGHHYFAMEIVPGRPLDAIARDPALRRTERLALFLEICEAVDYAHRRGVIHRDLKPSNILVTAEGRPKVLDFGLARIADPTGEFGTRLTETGGVQGTPRYMSPEQARGLAGDIDARTDVYSLGVILYELLTGQPPYETDRSFTPRTLEAICHEPPQRPSLVDRSLKGDLETIVLTCLRKEPEERYGSVAQLIEDLRRHRRGEPILARSPGTLRRLRARLTRYPALTAAVVTALVMSLVAVWWFQRPPYDVDSARSGVLQIRSRLFGDAPNAQTLSTALDLPRRYPGLLDAVLAKGHSLAITNEITAIRFLEMGAPSESWECRALLNEIRSVPAQRDSIRTVLWRESGGAAPDAEAWFMRSLTTPDRDSALAWSRRATALEPDHVLAWESVALLSEITGDLEEAVDGAARVMHLGGDPGRWGIYRNSLLIRLGRYEEARNGLDGLIETRPDFHAAYRVRASLNRRQGRYEAAAEDFTKALQFHVDARQTEAWLHYHRGTPLWIIGRLEEAAEDFREVYRRTTCPTYANARLYLVLRDLGRDDEARAALAEAREDQITEPWLGRVLDALAGEITPEQLVVEAGNDPTQLCEAYYYAGEICRLEGRDAEARDLFRACVGLGDVANPGDYLNPMSEQELARWRLGLAPEDANTDSTAVSAADTR